MVDRNPAHQRSSWPLLVGLGLVGLVTGALAGYFGYSFAVVAKNPLVSVADDSGEQPFDQTYREMARLAGLEIVAGKCDSAPDPRIIDQEKQLIDQIEVSAKRANLDPPLSIARAVVAYRGSAVQQETASSNWMSQWAAVGTYAELTNLQYQYAEDAHASAALVDFFKFA